LEMEKSMNETYMHMIYKRDFKYNN
jgi:hypothetical protein